MRNPIKRTGILVVLVLLIQAVTLASKPFEGVITYSITYPDAKFTESQMKMFPKILTVSVKGTKSRTELNTGMGNQISINDYTTKTVIALFEIMGQKYATKKTAEDLEKEMAKEPKATVAVTTETKTIAGYSCKKAIVTTEQDGEKTTYEVWFTPEIGNKLANFDNPLYKDVDGVLMEFSMKTPQFAMKFTATSVDKKSIDGKEFEIPADYKITTEDQLKSLMGGGGE